eukprot:m.25176 g.25176  ORF g.25176 m.25176 type:complete len:1412 (-) comp4404_c0_seq1:117-4352(-)
MSLHRRGKRMVNLLRMKTRIGPSAEEATIETAVPAVPNCLTSNSGCGIVAESFGELDFVEAGLLTQQAQFVRLDQKWAENHPELVYRMITDAWQLPPPSLLMSVTGGALSFDLPSELDRVVKMGIVQAAQYTRAWIVTGGSNSGVMKLIGDAIQLHQNSSQEDVVFANRIPVFGIATWGCMEAVDTLQGANGAIRQYEVSDSGRSLNQHHSHFLLIDDGSRQKFGVEIESRNALEAVIAAQTYRGPFQELCAISCVCIVVQGGPNSLKTASGSVRKRNPLVVIEGSGGAADILAEAWRLRFDTTADNPDGTDNEAELTDEAMEGLLASIKKWQPGKPLEVYQDWLKDVLAATEEPHMIQIYNHKEAAHGLEYAIFDVIQDQETHNAFNEAIAGDILNSTHIQRRIRKLEMALMWNRIDVAIDELDDYIPDTKLEQGTSFDHNPLHYLLKWAILHDRLDFVKLLMQNRYVDLNNFVSRCPAPSEAASQRSTTFQRSTTNASSSGLGYHPSIMDTSDVILAEELVSPHMQALFGHHVHDTWVQVKLDQGWSFSQSRSDPDRFHDLLCHWDCIPSDSRIQLRCMQLYVETLKVLEVMGYHVVPGNHTPVASRIALEKSLLHRTSEPPPQPYDLSHIQLRSDLLAIVDELASNIHDTWVLRKLRRGWRYGPKVVRSHTQKLHPGLKSYFDLDETDPIQNELKLWCAAVVVEILRMLLALQANIFRPTTLETLYIEVPTPDFYDFRGVLLKHDCSISRIRRLVQQLIVGKSNISKNDHYNPIVAADYAFVYPIFELMVWAILSRKHDLVKFLWACGPDQLARALFASRLYQSIPDAYHYLLPELATEFRDYGDHFGTLGYELLRKCHHADSSRTERILDRRFPYMGGVPLIALAYISDNEDIVEHRAFQALLKRKWKDGLKRGKNPTIKIIACIICPLLLPLIHLTPLELPSGGSDRFSSIRRPGVLHGSTSSHQSHGSYDRRNTAAAPDTRSFFQKARLFYISPITSYWLEVVCFVALIAYYSYVVILPIQDGFSTAEIILAVWMCCMALEELTQIITLGPKSWWSSEWNRIDLAIYLLFFLALILQLDPTQQLNAKTVLACNTMLLYVRLLRMYAKSAYLGPVMLMLQKMVNDMIVFIALLVVFLVSFGVATHAILFPFRSPDYFTFQSIIFRPYFQAFGELFLEDIQSETLCLGPIFTGCGETTGWVVPMLLALYLLVTNITLINLLIAMFNDTYQRVSSKQKKVWAVQNYQLLEEYKYRNMLTTFPAPINVLFNLFFLLKLALSSLIKTSEARLSGKAKLESTDASATPVMNLKVLRGDMDEVLRKDRSFVQKQVDALILERNEDWQVKLLRELQGNRGQVSDVTSSITELRWMMTRQQQQLDELRLYLVPNSRPTSSRRRTVPGRRSNTLH